MAQQIKKKYIKDDAIDGDKIKLLEDQSVRATDSNGNEINLISLGTQDQVLVNDQEVALKSDLTAESILRQAADDSLQSQINNIASNIDPAALDSLTEIVAAFQSADADINSAISSLGTGSSSALSAETTARQLADANLQSQIDTLNSRIQDIEAIAWGKVKITVDSSILSNGYIDLSVQVIPSSLHISVDRLTLHEGTGEDYSVSIVNGVSRITFEATMISGEQALSVGDNIYFKYQYKN